MNRPHVSGFTDQPAVTGAVSVDFVAVFSGASVDAPMEFVFGFTGAVENESKRMRGIPIPVLPSHFTRTGLDVVGKGDAHRYRCFAQVTKDVDWPRQLVEVEISESPVFVEMQ